MVPPSVVVKDGMGGAAAWPFRARVQHRATAGTHLPAALRRLCQLTTLNRNYNQTTDEPNDFGTMEAPVAAQR
jgi:hypothetical protein